MRKIKVTNTEEMELNEREEKVYQKGIDVGMTKGALCMLGIIVGYVLFMFILYKINK